VKESTINVAQKPDAGNRTQALESLGQSVWLDYLRRSLFTSGEFQRLVADDGLRGVTANPSIFEKAIVGSTDYLSALQQIEGRNDLEPMACTRRSPSTTFGTPPICSVPFMTPPVVRTATPVWKSRRISPTTRQRPSRRRIASGMPWIARM